MGKGQVAFEFTAMVAFAVIICMIFIIVIANANAETAEDQRIAAMNDVGYMIQDEFILASTVQDGYVRVIEIPTKADRFTYTLASDAEAVTLTSGKTTIAYSLPSYSGTLNKGYNVISKTGTISVS